MIIIEKGMQNKKLGVVKGHRRDKMEKQYDYLFQNALVVAQGAIHRWDIAVAGEKVVAIGPSLKGTANQEIDATGKYILPGIIDVHTHPTGIIDVHRQFKMVDDLQKLSETAAYGGVTTLIHYAFPEQGTKLMGAIERFREEGERTSLLDFGLHGGLLEPEHQAEEIPEAIQAGVTSFKFFMSYAKQMADDYQLMRGFDVIAEHGGLAMVHAENGLAMDYLEDKYLREGRDLAEVYLATRPGILEAEAINRAIAMAQVASCPLYIVHLAAREGVEVVMNAKRKGYRVFAETCPQFLTLTGKELLRWGAQAKLAPPLREEADSQALWRALRTGVISTVASDHGPHPTKREDDFFEANPGSPQVETMLVVVYTGGINGGWLSLPRLVQVMCENPARIFGLYPQKGTLQVGSDADLLIFDPTLEHTITHETQHSHATYTLYEGRRCLGKPVFSMQRGQVILEGDNLHVKPGRGRFIPTQSGKLNLDNL